MGFASLADELAGAFGGHNMGPLGGGFERGHGGIEDPGLGGLAREDPGDPFEREEGDKDDNGVRSVGDRVGVKSRWSIAHHYEVEDQDDDEPGRSDDNDASPYGADSNDTSFQTEPATPPSPSSGRSSPGPIVPGDNAVRASPLRRGGRGRGRGQPERGGEGGKQAYGAQVPHVQDHNHEHNYEEDYVDDRTHDLAGNDDPDLHPYEGELGEQLGTWSGEVGELGAAGLREDEAPFKLQAQRDPIVILEECLASGSAFLQLVRGVDVTPSSGSERISGLPSPTAIPKRALEGLDSPSLSARQGSPARQSSRSGGNRLEARVEEYLARIHGSRVARNRDADFLEELQRAWEEVQYGTGCQLYLASLSDFSEVHAGADHIHASASGRSVVAPGIFITSPTLPDLFAHPTSRSIHDSDIFRDSPSPTTPHSPAAPSPPALSPLLTLSAQLRGITTDPLPATFHHLSESLHAHASHTLAAQRQLRAIRAAIAGVRDHLAAEDAARAAVGAWEDRRVKEGLKGVGAGERLRAEQEGFEVALRGFEASLDRCRAGIRVGVARELRHPNLDSSG